MKKSASINDRPHYGLDEVQYIVRQLGLQGEWIRIDDRRWPKYMFKTTDGGKVSLRFFRRSERISFSGKQGVGARLQALVLSALAKHNHGMVNF